jgi:hypothetical protein
MKLDDGCLNVYVGYPWGVREGHTGCTTAEEKEEKGVHHSLKKKGVPHSLQHHNWNTCSHYTMNLNERRPTTFSNCKKINHFFYIKLIG